MSDTVSPDVAIPSDSLPALLLQVEAQRMALEVMTGKTCQVQHALQQVRDGLLREVVDLQRAEQSFYKSAAPNFFESQYTKTYGKGRPDAVAKMQEGIAHITDLLKEQNTTLRLLAAGTVHTAPAKPLKTLRTNNHNNAQKERLRQEVKQHTEKREAVRTVALQHAPPKTLTVEQLVALNQAAEEKHRGQLIGLQAEIDVLKKRVAAVNTAEAREMVDVTRQHFFELREGIFFVKHAVHVFRKWLWKNQVFSLLHDAAVKQSNKVQGLTLMLPLVTSIVHTAHRFTSSALRHPQNVQILNDVTSWWNSDTSSLPEDFMTGIPFKFENKGHFEQEALIMHKQYKLTTHLLHTAKSSRETCIKQAEEIEKLKTSIKELQAEKEFMEQQQNMLKMTIEEMANDRRAGKRGKRVKDKKDLSSKKGSSRSMYGAKSFMKGPGKKKSGLKRHSSRTSQKSFKFRSLSRSTSPGSATTATTTASRASFRSMSSFTPKRGKKGRKSIRPDRHHESSSSSSSSLKSTSIRKKKHEEETHRTREAEEIHEESEDSLSDGEIEAVEMFTQVMGARLVGQFFVKWLKVHYKRVGAESVRRTVAQTLHQTAAASLRGQRLGDVSRRQERDAVHKTMERVTRLTLPLHIALPGGGSSGARTQRRALSPQRCGGGGKEIYGYFAPPATAAGEAAVHMPRPPEGGAEAGPGLGWIQTWRAALHGDN